MLNLPTINTIKKGVEWAVIIKAFILSVTLEIFSVLIFGVIMLGPAYLPLLFPVLWMHTHTDVTWVVEVTAILVYVAVYSATFFYLACSAKHDIRRHFIVLAGVFFAYDFILYILFNPSIEGLLYALKTVGLLLTGMAAGYGLSRLRR